MATNRQCAAELIREGYCLDDIAKKWNKKAEQIRLYLLEQIAEQELFGSDVLLSLDDGTKRKYEEYIEEKGNCSYWTLMNECGDAGLAWSQFRLYLDCRDSMHRDMYSCLCTLEVFLHDKIRETLVEECCDASRQANRFHGRRLCVRTRYRQDSG